MNEVSCRDQLLVTLFAGAIFVGAGASPANRVSAWTCPQYYSTCHLEASNTTYADIYEAGCNCYVRWYWTLNTYNDQQPYISRHYELTLSTGSQSVGAGAVLLQAYIRVWICGSYDGEVSENASYTYRYTLITPEYGNATCGRQADDGASPNSGPAYEYGPANWYPQQTAVYLNQG